jgi:hypothetical protein
MPTRPAVLTRAASVRPSVPGPFHLKRFSNAPTNEFDLSGIALLISSCHYKRTLRRPKRLEPQMMTELKQKFDASTVAVMRQALDEVVSDHRFSMRESVTRLDVAEHILEQAASGVRDLDRLKNSAFEKLSATA